MKATDNLYFLRLSSPLGFLVLAFIAFGQVTQFLYGEEDWSVYLNFIGLCSSLYCCKHMVITQMVFQKIRKELLTKTKDIKVSEDFKIQASKAIFCHEYIRVKYSDNADELVKKFIPEYIKTIKWAEKENTHA